MTEVKEIPKVQFSFGNKLVSKIGYGCAGLGGIYGHENLKEGIESVHLAIKRGINYFDSAPYYGARKSETVLGQALKLANVPREDLFIATKVGRYIHENAEDGAGFFDFSRKTIEESVKKSLELLQVDYIDLIQCHDIDFVDPKYIIEEAIPTLLDLKAKGLVRGIGLTGYPTQQFLPIIDRFPKGTIDSVLSFAHYNLLNTQLKDHLLPTLHERGIAIMNASPLCLGLLTDQPPPDWHFSSAKLRKRAAEVATYCKSQGTSISKLGMQFALNTESRITVTIMGACTPAQVEENLSSFGVQPDPTLVKTVQDMFGEYLNCEWRVGTKTTRPVFQWNGKFDLAE